MEFVVGVDLVWVSNVLGKIKQRAKITEEVPEWLVHCDHAWQSPEVKDPERNFDVYASNANELISAQYGLTGFCVNLKSLSPDLTAAGKLPSCVHHCQVHVMKYGPISELAAELVAKPKQALFAVQ